MKKRRQIGLSPQEKRGICQEMFGADRVARFPFLNSELVQKVLMGTPVLIERSEGLSNRGVQYAVSRMKLKGFGQT